MPPYGWYLAQGLLPLGEDSSDDEEGPTTLPNGRIVCAPHGLVTCGKCCTDYSFMDDDDEDEEEEEDEKMNRSLSPEDVPAIDANQGLPSDFRIPEDLFGTKKRRGTGHVLPSKFDTSPSNHPTDLFLEQSTYGALSRYIHRDNPDQILIFTDGACLNNGQPNPAAGWAFVHGPGSAGQPLITSGRLERKGPFGEDCIQSSNRAELRAVIAALRFRHWVGEGFTSVVFATDSEYVVEGSTQWANSWVQNGWKTSAGKGVKNKDLWEMLLGEVERWQEKGLVIKFWRIPRAWNHVADAAAKSAAAEVEVDEWADAYGLCI
ncbi:hypothetical protein N0V90_008410 [Kalmusia sp. IMI 367209]|nr:hypothetical protein N0V90_008410 [Kalmusia sp. IMI 367209]